MDRDYRKECHRQFGAFIKSARRELKLTQQEVATIVGVDRSYYSRMENGERDIDLPIALRLCESLGLDINDFTRLYMQQ